MIRQLRAVMFSLHRLGLLGWTGLALIVAACGYGVIAVPQRNAQLESLRDDIAHWQQRRELLEAAAHNAPQAVVQAVLPGVGDTPAALLTLRDIARKDNLQVSRNDYHYEDAESAGAGRGGKMVADRNGLVEVHIAIPASGSYHDLRAFLSHALDKLPSLALDDAALKRDSIASGGLQAQLRFTLFVRRES